MLERILIPLDGSPAAEAVLPQVGRLLKRQDSEVVLFHAVSTPPIPDVNYGLLLGDPKAEGQTYVKAVESRLAAEGVRVRSVLKVGYAPSLILETVDAERCTMIAMSTHGRSGLARWAFGSVAEKVVRASPVPVLLLRSFAPSGGGFIPVKPIERPVRGILLPTDGREGSLAVVPRVVELARLFGCRVIVLRVIEGPGAGFAGELVEKPAVPPAAPKEGAPDEVTRYAAERLSSAGVPVVTLTVHGDPATGILDICASHDGDLIAMATHGRKGPSRWVLGSVTEKVLRASPVPMLVVRTDGP